MPDIKINLDRKVAIADKFPNECPQCHTGIHIDGSNKIGENTSLNHAFEVAFICPCCSRIFITTYWRKPGASEGVYFFDSSQPVVTKKVDIDTVITEVSPLFCDIYNQAHAAEQLKLDQIAGLGYRKALEFLVKDFCVTQFPADSETIKALWLKECINRLDNVKIKQAAERAAWLGNDETHYVRKFENKDINDLKNLLKIVQAHIVQEVMLKKYTDEMSKK